MSGLPFSESSSRAASPPVGDLLSTVAEEPHTLMAQAATSTTEENYTPIPAGYEVGRTKYIAVTGSVISGIGKGVFTSALCRLFVNRGMKVSPIKTEAYLNVDAGTLNPFRHGEVFVLDDGTETDMDLGSYERFLDQNLSRANFITAGALYKNIIEKERKGQYLGRDVQFIPHVTGETKYVLRNLAVKSKAHVVLIEVGGTVGDYENMFLMESIRELRHEEGTENVCIVNLTYILEPSSLGEFKTKAAQLGLRQLMQLGLPPDVIVCRSESPITDRVREKISVAASIPIKMVIGAHNMPNIYTLPLFLREKGVDDTILLKLKLDNVFLPNSNHFELLEWTQRCVVRDPQREVTVGIAGKYTGLVDSYISILKALEHCSAIEQVKVSIKWIEASKMEEDSHVVEALKDVDGLIVPGGFGKRGVEGKIRCIRFAREHKIPFLGLCYGMQLSVIEFARNVCGHTNANSTEVDPHTPHPVICILPEQEEVEGLGGSMRLGGYDVLINPNTLTHELYNGTDMARERFRHRYNVNPTFIEELQSMGMVFSGQAPTRRVMQISELPRSIHPFFLGSQFHPEYTSRPLRPNPCFLGFVRACLNSGRSLTFSLLHLKPTLASNTRITAVTP